MRFFLEADFRMMNRLVLALILLGIHGCTQEATKSSSSPPATGSAPEAPSPATQLVRLSAAGSRSLNVETFKVTATAARFPLAIPGTVFPAPDNIGVVSAPISGRVVQIMAHEGEHVRRGQVLAELESLEFASLAADYLQARADARFAESQVVRLNQLVEKKISSRSALEKAQADHVRAGAAVQAALARLSTLGVTEAQLASLADGKVGRPLLPIRSPISGVVSEHLIDLGQSVTAYEKMLSVVNLDRVLVKGYVSPDDAALVTPGNVVRISMKDYPDRVLEARVNTINPSLDEANKSITLNIIAATPQRWPMPGQSVRVEVLVSPPGPVMMLPLSAVQYEGERSTVFVRRDSLTFEKRSVQISRVLEDAVIVSSGLKEGEEVATTQVFGLKALDRYEQYAEE